MKDMSTPSAVSRVSFWTIAMITLTDHLIGTALLCLGTFADSLFTVAFPVAFVQFLNVLWFGQNFLAAVWAAQEGEAARSGRAQDGSAGSQVQQRERAYHIPIITMAGADTLPIPATAIQEPHSPASQPNPPPATENTTAVRAPGPPPDRDSVSLLGRFILAGFLLFLLTLLPLAWPQPARQRAHDLLSFLLLSVWAPQIARNAARNCRKALLWSYVLGQSALRLALMLYLYAHPGNAVFAAAGPRKAAAFAAWVGLQLAALAAQEALGPRALVPAAGRWLPPAHDYHPVLREGDEEARATILGAAAEPLSSPAGGRRAFDCAVCMHAVEVPVVPASSGAGEAGGRGGAFLWRRRYMVTPCRHVFHSKCLEAAMKYRLRCPICREALPPL